MTQKSKLQSRLIEERAKALATIILTRRSDVTIREVTSDFGIDLITTIENERKPGLRQFGVELKGAWGSVTPREADALLEPALRQVIRSGPLPYPVVAFLFTMQDDKGWYTWASEPLLEGDSQFELRLQEEAYCRPLDAPAVDEIIDRVDTWYDSFYARISRKGRGIHTRSH